MDSFPVASRRVSRLQMCHKTNLLLSGSLSESKLTVTMFERCLNRDGKTIHVLHFNAHYSIAPEKRKLAFPPGVVFSSQRLKHPRLLKHHLTCEWMLIGPLFPVQINQPEEESPFCCFPLTSRFTSLCLEPTCLCRPVFSPGSRSCKFPWQNWHDVSAAWGSSFVLKVNHVQVAGNYAWEQKCTQSSHVWKRYWG